MNATVSAVYEQGALHLVSPLKLPERSQVWVQVLSDNTDEQEQEGVFKRYLATVRRLMASLELNWSSHLVRQLFPKQVVLTILSAIPDRIRKTIPTRIRSVQSVFQLAPDRLPAFGLEAYQPDARRAPSLPHKRRRLPSGNRATKRQY